LDNVRDSYRAVKKDRFAGANRWFEISMVVLRTPLHATSPNNLAALAGCSPCRNHARQGHRAAISLCGERQSRHETRSHAASAALSYFREEQ
jgi:hypothetical protein